MLPNRSMVSVRGSASAFSAVTGAGGAFSAGAGEWLLHPKVKPDSNPIHRKKAHDRGREMDRFMKPISEVISRAWERNPSYLQDSRKERLGRGRQWPRLRRPALAKAPTRRPSNHREL